MYRRGVGSALYTRRQKKIYKRPLDAKRRDEYRKQTHMNNPGYKTAEDGCSSHERIVHEQIHPPVQDHRAPVKLGAYADSVCELKDPEMGSDGLKCLRIGRKYTPYSTSLNFR